MKEASLNPAKDMNLVSLFNDSPMHLAIVVLPVPGGPLIKITIPLSKINEKLY